MVCQCLLFTDFEMDGLIFCYMAIGKYIKERYIDDNIEHKKEIAFVSFRE